MLMWPNTADQIGRHLVCMDFAPDPNAKTAPQPHQQSEGLACWAFALVVVATAQMIQMKMMRRTWIPSRRTTREQSCRPRHWRTAPVFPRVESSACRARPSSNGLFGGLMSASLWSHPGALPMHDHFVSSLGSKTIRILVFQHCI